MEKGIRQGDPFSPYLYVIVAEALHLMFSVASSHGLIHGFRIDHFEVNLNHLQYADDSILFLKADEEELNMVHAILLWF